MSSHLFPVDTIDDGSSLSFHLIDMGKSLLVHLPAARDDKCLVTRAGLCLQASVLIVCVQQKTLADIVAVEASLIYFQNTLDKLRCFLCHGVDIKLHQQ